MKKIKLILKGKKKHPFFQIGIIDSRLRTNKRYLLGYYNPKEYMFLLNYSLFLQNLKLGASSTKNLQNICLYQLKFNLINFNLINN